MIQKIINYFKSKQKLIELADEKEHAATMREREAWYEKEKNLKADYGGRILTESENAADKREKAIMEKIVAGKNEKINELEAQVIEQNIQYRNFSDEAHEYEIVINRFNTDLQAAQSVLENLVAKVESLNDDIRRIVRKIEKKELRLIEKK